MRTTPYRHAHKPIWSGQYINWYSFLQWLWAVSCRQLKLTRIHWNSVSPGVNTIYPIAEKLLACTTLGNNYDYFFCLLQGFFFPASNLEKDHIHMANSHSSTALKMLYGSRIYWLFMALTAVITSWKVKWKSTKLLNSSLWDFVNSQQRKLH